MRGWVIAASTIAIGAGLAEGRSVAKRPIRPQPRAPHINTIDMIALAADGKAVVTRDAQGGVRFWPSLDGATEPVTFTDTKQISSIALAPRPGGYTIGIIDTAGGARLFVADDEAQVKQTARLPASDPMASIAPVPGEDAVIALAADRTIRLLATDGKELARLERRAFSPMAICVAADGASALVREAFDDEVVVLDIKTGKTPSLTVRPEEVKLPDERAHRSIGTCSPDAKKLAYTFSKVKNGQMDTIRVVERDGTHKEFAVPPENLNGSVAFLDEGSMLIVPAGPHAASWRLDLATGDLHPRPSTGTQFGVVAQSVAKGRRVAAAGTWIVVHDVEARKTRWMGYDGFFPQTGAVASSGAVAWTTNWNQLVVDPPSGAPVILSSGAASRRANRLTFADDDHLITMDDAGAVTLWRWKDRKILDQADGGGFAAAYFDYQPATKLLRLSSGAGTHLIYQVKPGEGFEGPWVIADGSYFGGLVAAKAGSELALWTLDHQGKRREYTLDELKKDLTRKDMHDRGAKDEQVGTPNAFDGAGRKYLLRYEGEAVIDILHGKDRRTLKIGGTDVSTIWPSPDGSRVLVVSTRGTVRLFSTAADARKALWSFGGTFAASVISWSPDGRFVAVAAGGGVVLDSATGEAVKRRCSGGFVVSDVAPWGGTVAFEDLGGLPADDHVCAL